VRITITHSGLMVIRGCWGSLLLRRLELRPRSAIILFAPLPLPQRMGKGRSGRPHARSREERACGRFSSSEIHRQNPLPSKADASMNIVGTTRHDCTAAHVCLSNKQPNRPTLMRAPILPAFVRASVPPFSSLSARPAAAYLWMICIPRRYRIVRVRVAWLHNIYSSFPLLADPYSNRARACSLWAAVSWERLNGWRLVPWVFSSLSPFSARVRAFNNRVFRKHSSEHQHGWLR
jgi:hypothetical protein